MRSELKGWLARGAVLIPLSGLVVLGGCVYRVHDRPRAVYVSEAPPRERVEVIGVAPSPDHIWVRGHYVREGNRWEWEPGRWMMRPRRGAEWAEGHWDRGDRGYIWIEGRWR